jgi:hypothetical protein
VTRVPASDQGQPLVGERTDPTRVFPALLLGFPFVTYYEARLHGIGVRLIVCVKGDGITRVQAYDITENLSLYVVMSREDDVSRSTRQGRILVPAGSVLGYFPHAGELATLENLFPADGDDLGIQLDGRDHNPCRWISRGCDGVRSGSRWQAAWHVPLRVAYRIVGNRRRRLVGLRLRGL